MGRLGKGEWRFLLGLLRVCVALPRAMGRHTANMLLGLLPV